MACSNTFPQRRFDRLYMHGPTFSKPWSLNHGPCTRQEHASPTSRPWHRTVTERHSQTMVLRGRRQWLQEGEDHAGAGDHASSCFTNQDRTKQHEHELLRRTVFDDGSEPLRYHVWQRTGVTEWKSKKIMHTRADMGVERFVEEKGRRHERV